MRAAEMNIEQNVDLSTLSPSALNDIYDRTIEGLRKCSTIVPGDVSDDENTDKIELSLLKFELSVLRCASQVRLRSKDDVDDLMDVWAKASGINSGEDIRPTDKIVMNIFRHLSGELDWMSDRILRSMVE